MPGADSRRFTYFTPTARRPTVYEDVTVDVQPDTTRHLAHGWIFSSSDGRPVYDPDDTRIRSSDWHRFRDPNEEWERSLYRNQANAERQITQVIASARTARVFDDWDTSWRRAVQTHVGAWMHAEFGLGMYVLLPAQRYATTNMVNNALAVNVSHKLRAAQDLALYTAEIGETVPAFDPGAHRVAWLEYPCWQPVRKLVERMMGIADWGEALFVTNVVFEPLVGEFFRRQLVLRCGAWHGDYVTPAVIGLAMEDFERDRRWTHALLSMLAEDAVHRVENGRTMREWLRTWLDETTAAADALACLYDEVGHAPIDARSARDQLRAEWKQRIGDFGGIDA
jgi:propane monooxygenase small subunit